MYDVIEVKAGSEPIQRERYYTKKAAKYVKNMLLETNRYPRTFPHREVFILEDIMSKDDAKRVFEYRELQPGTTANFTDNMVLALLKSSNRVKI